MENITKAVHSPNHRRNVPTYYCAIKKTFSNFISFCT